MIENGIIEEQKLQNEVITIDDEIIFIDLKKITDEEKFSKALLEMLSTDKKTKKESQEDLIISKENLDINNKYLCVDTNYEELTITIQKCSFNGFIFQNINDIKSSDKAMCSFFEEQMQKNRLITLNELKNIIFLQIDSSSVLRKILRDYHIWETHLENIAKKRELLQEIATKLNELNELDTINNLAEQTKIQQKPIYKFNNNLGSLSEEFKLLLEKYTQANNLVIIEDSTTEDNEINEEDE